jgi:AcrR family transcriptional regulator
MVKTLKDLTRAEKRCETKKKLLESACKLFSKKEFEEVKVSDITEDAGLAKGTFFNYFTNKEDVISEVQYMISCAPLLPILDQPGLIVPQLKKAILAIIVDGNQSKPLTRAVLLTKLKDMNQLVKNSDQFKQFYNAMIQLVDKAKEQKEIRTDLPSLQVVMMVEQMYMGLLIQWCYALEEINLAQNVEYALDVLFLGLRPVQA